MASKATVRRQKSAEKVIAAGTTHKGLIAGTMGERYGEDLGPAVELVLDKLMADLASRTAFMIQKDDAHEEELRDDPALREQRDMLSDGLYDRLVLTRGQLEAICGPEYVALLGFGGPTPEDPVEVHRLGRIVAANLVEVVAPEPLLPGYTFDPALWQAPIAEHLDTLEQTLTAVAEEARQAEATLTAKHRAIEEYDQAFSATANLISSFLAMAGQKELAKRVRPSSRRPGQTDEVAESPDPAVSA